MRQKVAICCGYLHEPKAILLDEPLNRARSARHPDDAGVDPAEGRGRVRRFMVSSHLLSLVEDLCTSVLVLHRGRMLVHGSLGDLRAHMDDEGRHETLERPSSSG